VTYRWLILICTAAALVSGGRAVAQDKADIKLRHWYLGVQVTAGERDRWDVFGQEGLPPVPVAERGNGGGILFGYRFGDRFLLGLQLAVTEHDLEGVAERLFDTEFLVTGTVLFRERHTLQPFLRGGFGAGGTVLESPDGAGRSTSLGTAVVAGAGFQVRLSSRFSLEWELVANFTNVREIHIDSEAGASTIGHVKISNVGWRNGIGLMIWF
jgi:hypothetical protein